MWRQNKDHSTVMKESIQAENAAILTACAPNTRHTQLYKTNTVRCIGETCGTPICYFTHYRASTAWAGLGQSQEPGVSSKPLLWVQEPKDMGSFHCYSRPLAGSWIYSGADAIWTSAHMRNQWHSRWQLNLSGHNV